VLKYTYVFGYYLPNGSEKTLFEFLQQDLEKNTEHLSELWYRLCSLFQIVAWSRRLTTSRARSETPIEHINSAEVVNHSRVTAKVTVSYWFADHGAFAWNLFPKALIVCFCVSVVHGQLAGRHFERADCVTAYTCATASVIPLTE